MKHSKADADLFGSCSHVAAAALDNTLEENARLFALLNIAMADAAICAWDAKYTFHFWRPVTHDCLRSSLEVFNNDTGDTTAFMGGAAA
jgi:hypothetical protein